MDRARNHHFLEIEPLKLAADSFPLSRSARHLILEKFADPAQSGSGTNAMSAQELEGYIRDIRDFECPPLEAVLAQAEIIGEPALPSLEQVALLRWLGKALQTWESTFPLEKPLRSRLRDLKPLLAAAAVIDTSFAVPGAHPLHQILDDLHDLTVGWQPSLGRAGAPAQKLLEQTVSDCLKYFESGTPSLQKLADTLRTSTAKIRQRNERMTQRAAEAERGKLRTLRAKALAANRINRALAQFQVPQSVGDFVTGPWYDSAQLLILKFGESSQQWRDMSTATDGIMRALQYIPNTDENNAQLHAQHAAKMSDDIRKWSLKLEHDKEAIEQAISVIEYAHLRLVRKQPLEQSYVPLIPLVESPSLSASAQPPAKLPKGLQPGQRFLVSPRGREPQRVQLTIMLEAEQLLLFYNQAGIKVAPLSYHEFTTLLTDGNAKLLHTGATFSRVLAGIVGITSAEELAKFGGDATAKTDQVARPTKPAAASSIVNKVIPLPKAQTGAVNTEQASATALELELSENGREKLPELPMGHWLGFHDVNPPLLAKLALHDEGKQLLIFVNRKGIEQRRLTETEYLALVDKGLIDSMESTTSFREQVERTRQRLQNSQP